MRPADKSRARSAPTRRARAGYEELPSQGSTAQKAYTCCQYVTRMGAGREGCLVQSVRVSERSNHTVHPTAVIIAQLEPNAASKPRY